MGAAPAGLVKTETVASCYWQRCTLLLVVMPGAPNVASLLLPLVIVTSCIANDTFLAIPSSWTVFEMTQLSPSSSGVRDLKSSDS